MVLQLTSEELRQAREWISECAWGESQDELDELTDQQIERGIARHYVGGIQAFKESCV